MDQSGGGDSWDFKAGGVFKRLLAACAGDRNLISAPSLPADSTPSPTATGAPLPPPPCLPPPSATLNLPPPIHPKLPPSQHQQRLPLKSLPGIPLPLLPRLKAWKGDGPSLTSSFWASSWASSASLRCAASSWARGRTDARRRLQKTRTGCQNRRGGSGRRSGPDAERKTKTNNSQQSLNHRKQNK